MLNFSRPFIIFATCKIEYDGRASSILDNGNYLIIHKNDGCFSIHANDLNIPRNYMGSGTIVNYNNNVIIATNKNETIKVFLQQVLSYNILNDWASNKAVMYRTEKQLVDKLENNISQYVQCNISNIIREFQTAYGPVDLVVVSEDNFYYIFEVKRKKATISSVTQLKKYNDWFIENNLLVRSYLVAPSIANNAILYLEKFGFTFIALDFDYNNNLHK